MSQEYYALPCICDIAVYLPAEFLPGGKPHGTGAPGISGGGSASPAG